MSITGQCLCGAVRFNGSPDRERGISVCHCGQCRRWAGGGPYFAVRMQDGVTLTRDEGLAWFRSSDHGERGFCRHCGTSLFWRVPGSGMDVAVSAGTLEPDHGLEIGAHIWVDDQPDFYEFADSAPRLTAAQAMARAASRRPGPEGA